MTPVAPHYIWGTALLWKTQHRRPWQDGREGKEAAVSTWLLPQLLMSDALQIHRINAHLLFLFTTECRETLSLPTKARLPTLHHPPPSPDSDTQWRYSTRAGRPPSPHSLCPQVLPVPTSTGFALPRSSKEPDLGWSGPNLEFSGSAGSKRRSWLVVLVPLLPWPWAPFSPMGTGNLEPTGAISMHSFLSPSPPRTSPGHTLKVVPWPLAQGTPGLLVTRTMGGKPLDPSAFWGALERSPLKHRAQGTHCLTWKPDSTRTAQV